MKLMSILLLLFVGSYAWAGDAQEWLVKFKDGASVQAFSAGKYHHNRSISEVGIANWVKAELTEEQVEALSQHPDVLTVEKNIMMKIMLNVDVHDPIIQQQIADLKQTEEFYSSLGLRADDNPEIPLNDVGGTGTDPLFNKQWGMQDNNVKNAWSQAGTKGATDVIVAVIDTGVDYTHEDIIDNLWRNTGEMGTDANGQLKATNGIDDDNNGFIDDVVGWDFAVDDNKPYDLSQKGFQVLLGGNPGHGTHCAGNVAARADNGKGIAGVAPNVKIMAMRFLTEKGQGTLEGAVKSIKYAVDNGAQILSNSWGSEGDGGDAQASQMLQDAILYAQNNGVLFVAAAGNGHQGVGYDNDTDAKPAYPASYPQENIISVAALDVNDQLGSFSNWGRRTVDIGAPGVKVFSTVPDNDYQDTVIDIPGLVTATWDGTSMATPHVAGAAALYLSKHPDADWREIKDAILNSARPVGSMNGKSVSNGKLDVQALLNM